MNAALLQARGVAKSFGGVPALRDGCLELHRGSVHALCGGNGAGKSTLLNIVMGILRRDAGEILLKGRPVDFATPHEALSHRISIITQELSPIPGMSVAENIFLGREPTRAGLVVDYRRLFEAAQALLAQLGFAIDARTPMGRLSLAQTQLVEIAKAFSRQSELIIMDEPTSALGESETAILFDAIRRVTARGAGILYVSHRLTEIFTIADRYTVLRDGGFVQSGRMADIDRRGLVKLIVGREVGLADRARKPSVRGEPLLSVQGLARQGEFEDIDLQVAPGEVLGIYGLMGSGRSEFLNCLYGLTRADRGQARLRGKALPEGDPRASIRAGLALVTEDRKATGLVLSASVGFNASLSALPRLQHARVIDLPAERSLVGHLLRRLRVKLASPAMPVSGLSGGNQQKVVLARCVATEPVCLLCDEPTRGIDEGAKREVHAFLAEFAAQGHAVVVVSSEAPELLEVSDRIAIFRKGRIAEVIPGHGATQEELLHLAS
ncbi:Galactose/methyl galactoside import ATP-binding protein MglA [Delftia tsuruhatensis]|uniref:sugar ABC transporter ATP-binding protein n=1 Tax=Delftia tsuruhatensis TaxID=180282 RepID=UPI001E79ED13|nr:sugar ABC transporter ATP-binding protein [Delftia tsuruhatensis]CAB5715834.1 Galactose/methyl galactoside import ATP-binding protein MglA [Delftia tsuruhatensis]CAC9681365.1 Galactose/methyl galactoside import ATP-binding protein MglA [Delftia tsuruhatensis]